MVKLEIETNYIKGRMENLSAYLKKSGIKIFALLIMLTALAATAYASENSAMELFTQENVRADKVWKITFNKKLKKETVNNINITVEKMVSGKEVVIYPKVVLSDDGQTVLVNAPVEGYTPTTEYYMTVTQGVRAEDGAVLRQEVKKKYTIENQAIDESSYEDLPKVGEFKLGKEPIINGDKEKLTFNLQGEGKLQYRLFLFKFGDTYREMTTGYSKEVSSGTVLEFLYDQPLSTGKYKAILYVKRANSKGKYEDSNTDFDNYKIINFKCLDKLVTENVEYINYNISFDKLVDSQFNLEGSSAAKYDNSGKWINSSKDLVRLYSKPENFLDEDGKYMFLKLNYVEGITEDMLKELLQNKGILDGTEKAFLEAAKKNDINPVYFAIHAIHESDYGKSVLSNGVEISTVNGQVVEKKRVYNILGIKAEDDEPIRKASEYAYSQGWSDINLAIMGAAEYVSQRYINKPIYNDKPDAVQNTLYKMRWNPAYPATYQYATDIRWAYTQSTYLRDFFNKYKEVKLEFEVPKFN